MVLTVNCYIRLHILLHVCNYIYVYNTFTRALIYSHLLNHILLYIHHIYFIHVHALLFMGYTDFFNHKESYIILTASCLPAQYSLLTLIVSTSNRYFILI